MNPTEIEQTKAAIHELYNSLLQQPEQSPALLNITDVLLQVYQKLDQVKNPEVLMNKLVNYIYVVGFDAKLHFLGRDEKLLQALEVPAKKAGFNSKYRANFSDKSQFYSYNEEIPRR